MDLFVCLPQIFVINKKKLYITHCVAGVDVDIGLEVLEDFVQMSSSRGAQKGRVAVRLQEEQ